MIKRINVFKKERRQSMSDNPEEGSYKEEEKPEWYDKKIEEDIASEEEIKKLENMMARK